MPIHGENALERIDAAIKRWQNLKSHSHYRWLQAFGPELFVSDRIELVEHLIETIEELSPAGSGYPDDAREALEAHGLGSVETGDTLVRILEALRDDL